MNTRHLIGTLALALSLAGCGVSLRHYDGYHGDGTFSAQLAPWICQDGYTVDLGEVDLTAPGEITRTLQGLPAVESTIGLALERRVTNAPAPGDAPDARRPTAMIEVTLRDPDGRIVLSRHERLSEWVGKIPVGDADHAYLYRPGTTIEVRVALGAIRLERFPIGLDDSWGTYFQPRREARYTLHFAVEEPDTQSAGVAARLQINAVADCL